MKSLNQDAMIAELQRFEAMIRRAERRGVRALSPAEAEAFPQLYRLTLTAVMNARSRPLERSFHDYADQLAQRAWAILYIERQSLWRTLWQIVWTSVPALLWRLKGYMALNIGIFLVGLWSAQRTAARDASTMYTFVPEAMSDSFLPGAPAVMLHEMLYLSQDGGPIEVAALFRVPHLLYLEGQSLLSLLLAAVGGFLSPVMTFTTGSAFGAMSHRFSDADLIMDYHFWWLCFSLPALLGLLLTNSAGTAMVRALVFPGPLGRKADVRARWRDIVAISWVALVLMLLTGVLALGPNLLPTTLESRWGLILLQAAMILPVLVRGYFAQRTEENPT